MLQTYIRELPLSGQTLASMLAAAFLLLLAGYLLAALLAGRRQRKQQAAHERRERTLQADLEGLQQQLEQQRQMHHESEKRLGMTRVSLQAANERNADLASRLQQTQLELGQKREAGELLRERLAGADRKVEALSASSQELRSQMEGLHQQLHAQQQEHRQLQKEYQQLGGEHVELRTSLERKQEHFDAQLQQLQDSRQQLAQEFENIANKIFEEKGKSFTQSSQAGIDSLLKPFREQIETFQKRVNEVHDAALEGNTRLNAEIRKVLEIGLKMSEDASSLTSALRGDSQQRGAWGEAQLRRTLEMSGLIEDDHYEVQSSFRDEEGRQKQTDYLIRLPDGKHIIIDSKVTLNAYERVVAAETPEEEQLALAEHARAVRRHIDDLAGKDYSNLAGVHSPNFVLMFMPVEPAYIEALKHDRELFEYGYRKNVVLVSHTTLIPVLRTVSNLWMMERSQAEAREISDRAGDIYNQVCMVAERLARLGNTLGTVSNHYNGVVTSLVGQQGLYGKVERFGQLSARVSREMPALEARHLDFEHDRLQLAVTPLEDVAVADQPVDEAATDA